MAARGLWMDAVSGASAKDSEREVNISNKKNITMKPFANLKGTHTHTQTRTIYQALK